MRALLAIAATLALAGCDDQSMVQQRRYDTYAPAALWSDGSSARPLPAGTVARGDLARAAEGTTPPPLTPALMRSGEEQFNIFCAPCHGRSGDGQGMIVQRGFPTPPPLAVDRLRSASAQHLYDVITNGYGVMYPFASRIEPTQRWAIVAYMRALQLSQNAKLADVPDAGGQLP